MKRASIATMGACATVTLVTVAFSQMSQTASRAGDERAIRRVIDDQTAAFNRHEVDRSLFTTDADFVNARGIWLQGADAIERGRQAQFRGVLKSASIRLLDIRVRFVRPDVAIAHATYEISGMTGPDGVTMPPHKEIGLRVLTKTKDRWLVTAFQITTIDARRPEVRQ
ncbi:MAG: SgcJ/EcaC family oxidoreductase [Acidobacteria bacterium]|nr:SgcJ/EcaC family oxidoreductase [Acidobacteriota bacterium]